MSLWSVLRGAAAQVNPFDNGKTYSTYNVPQKKRPQDQPTIVRPTPNPGIVTNADNTSNVITKKPTDFGTLHMPNTVSVPQPDPNKLPSNEEIAAKSAGAIGADAAGGAIGAIKGIIQTPEMAKLPNAGTLVRMAAAKATLNRHAYDKAVQDSQTQNIGHDINKFVKPLVNPALVVAAKPIQYAYNKIAPPVVKALTKAETTTDKTAQNLAPWQTNTEKNVVKGLVNVAPVDAAIAPLAAAATATKVARGTEAARVAEAARIAEMNRVHIPVVGGDKTALPIPTRVVTGKPIQDVTQRLPGETPALAPTPKAPNKVSLPGKLIQDVSGGETYQTPNALVQHTAEETMKQAADRFNSTDRAVSTDITPQRQTPIKVSSADAATNEQKVIDEYAKTLKDMGQGNGVDLVPNGEKVGYGMKRTTNNVRFGDTKGKKYVSKADWQAEAERQLRAGQAETGTQAAFNDASNAEVQSLLKQGEQAPTPVGTPIRVKQVKGIDVQRVNDVPANLPETPGQVRVSTQTDPVAAQTEAIAAQPVVAAPAPLPKVGATLPDGTKVTKAMVKAARENNKNAKKLAKTQADTQAVVDSMPNRATQLGDNGNVVTPGRQFVTDANGNAVEAAVPQGNPGTVPTGEYKQGINGNAYEVAHQSTEQAQAATDTATMSAQDVITKAAQENNDIGGLTDESIRNIVGMQESGRFAPGSPEAVALESLLDGAGSKAGQRLSLFNKTLRRLAKGDTLANRFINKLIKSTQDTSKITDAHIAEVTQKENAFTNARDAASQALDRYNATKSAEDFNAWKQAQQAASEAEKHALITEYRVSKDVLKGNKNPEALKAINEAEKKAGVYQMDWIDANMLSGTGTGTRNYVNTALVRTENRLFGGRGYRSKGAHIGNEVGNKSVVSDFKARNELDQNLLSKGVKQWSTTMNTLGEGNIRAVGTARAYRYYEKALQKQGIVGDQLKRDVEVMLHTDPEKMMQHYEALALNENALSGLAHSRKLEQSLVDAIASKGGGKLSQTGAKALVRLTVGFPTVIGRSLYGGVKRATLGLPDLIDAGRQFAKGDKQAMVDALYTAKVHAGSGASLYALGAALASAGIISPSYPKDPAERERWKSEGIQPNSIKIAGNWFSIPGYFGALALPFTVPADVINKSSPEEVARGVLDSVEALSPTAGIVSFINGMGGRGGDQWVKNELTSLTRAVTPVGALLNEVAKMTDSTKNDTTTKDAIHNLLDSIASGIPGLNNKVNTIDATDANGNMLHNPNPLAIAAGASGSDQQQGIQDVQQQQQTANDTYTQLKDVGVLDNPHLMGLVDKKTQAQITRGQDLTPDQVKKIQDTVTKGISTSISADGDSNWRQNGDYATDRTARQVKLQLLQNDPLAKNSDIAGLKTQIARDNVLEKYNVPYDQLKLYQTTTQGEWAKMGQPQYNKYGELNENYDPATYNLLANLDKVMAEAGGSYNTDPVKNKYDPKGAGTGSGSHKKAAKMGTNFGILSTSGNPMAPKARQYQTASMSGTSNIPVINVVRPNIVHKIGRG